MANVLTLKNIHYIRNDKPILENINLSIDRAEHTVLMGKNGSGKSTLLNIIYGYYWSSQGDVYLFGKKFGEFPIFEIQKKIGFLQTSIWEDRLQKNISVFEVICTGINQAFGIYKEYSKEEINQVENIIEENSSWLKDPLQNFFKCSNGERKKILLLRALISSPELLILDEPCSSLDIVSKIEFLKLLKENQQNKTILLVTHSVEEILPFYKKVLFLKDGKTLAFGDKEEILNSKNFNNCFGINIELNKIKEYYTISLS